MMDLLMPEIIDILMVLLTAFAGIVTKYVVSFLKEKGVVTKMENNKETVKIVVNAVEQLYKEHKGKDKFNMAKSELVQLANEKKLKVTEQELDLLIEAVVNEMNRVIKEEKQK